MIYVVVAVIALAVGVIVRMNDWSIHYPTSPRVLSTDSTPVRLDFDVLRAYTDANSRSTLRWGTYRSGQYYGIRSRTYPASIAAGLLWGSNHEDVSQLRHECRQEDRLQKYGWLQHNGRSYGLQRIEDQFNHLQIDTYFLRHLNTVDGWSSRFVVSHLEPRQERFQRKSVTSTKFSLFFYIELGCDDEKLERPCRRQFEDVMDVSIEPVSRPCEDNSASTCVSMTITSAGVNNDMEPSMAFDVIAQLQTSVNIQTTEMHYTGLSNTNVLNVKDKLVALAAQTTPQADAEIVLDDTIADGSTLMVIQVVIESDINQLKANDVIFDVLYQEKSSTPVMAPTLSPMINNAIETHRAAFEHQFEVSFALNAQRDMNESKLAFAQAAFSNLIGGISFFYGRSLFQLDTESPVVESPNRPLFTAVPSRSFFPRGFLWDEGFHQLGIQHFDPEITRDIVVHWLALMHEDGYIEREQILGESARRRVPHEFQVQHSEHANPPTLLLTLDHMIKTNDNQTREFIEMIFPFVERWFTWFITTQEGDEPGTFRWRGRRANDGKLISNTLSSGLDDYPRASTVSSMEKHLDLSCWMIKASSILGKLATILGYTEKAEQYQKKSNQYREVLEKIHWNDDSQSYFDVGEHSSNGHIEEQIVIRCRNTDGEALDATISIEKYQQRKVDCPPSHPQFMFPLGDGQGGLQKQPVFVPGTTFYQHVAHTGYVSLFPLLLKVVPIDSKRLSVLLEQLAAPEHLWTPYGLRSMSTTDVFYEQENAHGDNPYWRGSIWININYLALSALHYYAAQKPLNPSTTNHVRSKQLYLLLRDNVINNIYREYERTGYLWEQYSGDAHAQQHYGRGQRCHPFSGWTSLVVNIMAEKY